MVQRPYWEANWFAASQEIPRISRNPTVHYSTHKRPPPVPILGQPNSLHIPISHLLQIHPNIIHPSTPRSPQWSLSLRFPHQDPILPPLLTHTRHMPSPSSGKNFTFFLGILKFDAGQKNTDGSFSIHSAVTTVEQSHYRPGVAQRVPGR